MAINMINCGIDYRVEGSMIVANVKEVQISTARLYSVSSRNFGKGGQNDV